MTSNELGTKVQDILPDMWREVCSKGTTLRFKVSSGSMLPLLDVGDVIKVCRVEPSVVCVGDLVAFQDGNDIIVHRIIAKKSSHNKLIFRHRGENAVSSGFFEGKNLIGRIISVEKEGREISLETLWHKINNKAVGWGLRLTDSIHYRCPRYFHNVFHIVSGLVWRLYQRLRLLRL